MRTWMMLIALAACSKPAGPGAGSAAAGAGAAPGSAASARGSAAPGAGSAASAAGGAGSAAGGAGSAAGSSGNAASASGGSGNAASAAGSSGNAASAGGGSGNAASTGGGAGNPAASPAGARSASTASTAASAGGASPAPKLPEGLRALVAGAPLPALATDEVLLLSAKPGTPVVLTGTGGQKLSVPEGLIARTTGAYDLVGGWTADSADRAAILAPGGVAHAAQIITRAEDTGGSVPHHEVWFVPTVGARTQLAEDAAEILADWSDPQQRWAVVMLDHGASLVDVKTGAARPIAAAAGSPSYAPDGTLYYRTLDGGAWRWTGTRGEKLGKGKRGQRQTGDLNDGITPARFPPPVTFDTAGKPKFK